MRNHHRNQERPALDPILNHLNSWQTFSVRCSKMSTSSFLLRFHRMYLQLTLNSLFLMNIRDHHRNQERPALHTILKNLNSWRPISVRCSILWTSSIHPGFWRICLQLTVSNQNCMHIAFPHKRNMSRLFRPSSFNRCKNVSCSTNWTLRDL